MCNMHECSALFSASFPFKSHINSSHDAKRLVIRQNSDRLSTEIPPFEQTNLLSTLEFIYFPSNATKRCSCASVCRWKRKIFEYLK